MTAKEATLHQIERLAARHGYPTTVAVRMYLRRDDINFMEYNYAVQRGIQTYRARSKK